MFCGIFTWFIFTILISLYIFLFILTTLPILYLWHFKTYVKANSKLTDQAFLLEENYILEISKAIYHKKLKVTVSKAS